VIVHNQDDFLLDLFDLAPSVVLRTLHRQLTSYKRDPRTITGQGLHGAVQGFVSMRMSVLGRMLNQV
jgi:hypothetical protein